MNNRIVHITSAHSALDTRIFYKECRSLARAGYEVVLLGSHSMNEVRDGVRFVGVGKSRSRRDRMTGKQIALGREAFRLNAYLYQLHDPELLALGLLLRLAGKRVLYDIHEDLPRTVLYKRYIPIAFRKPLMRVVEHIENFAAKCMTGLVAATPAIGKRFSTRHARTVVVNNYPLRDELKAAQNSAWSERMMSVAYIGGISEERGIKELLCAIDFLPQTLGGHLELAGRFFCPALQAKLAATPQWKNVLWRGMLDRNGIAALLGRVRAGLVILHPEQNFLVSQPIKLFEYMAAGIPVIASDFPLWREIIQGSGCGVLVDPLDPKAIAAAVERLLTDPAWAEELGRRGRKAVEERFNWNTEEGTLLSFYSSLLSSSRIAAKGEVGLEASRGTV
jgi:glycosyltransferase involved in cell wall biosynthesis